MPQAEVDDGKMRMVVFKEFSLLDSLKILPQLIMGELKNSDTVIYRTFKHATVAILDKYIFLLPAFHSQPSPL